MAIVALSGLSAAHAEQRRPLIVRHAHVVDTRNGKILEDQDVTIVGERIRRVARAGTVRIDRTSLVVDARGKYLIPGLWDCHVHLSWTSDSALPLFIALGITEVRDLGGRLTELEEWRARIADGTLVGPNIMRVGPILNGKSFNAYQFVPGSPEATRGAVRLLAFLGMDEIKVHRRMPRDWYYAAIDEAKKLRIDLVGHIPLEVAPEEASKAGQYIIEHTETLFEGTFSANLTEAQLPGAIREWIASGKSDELFAAFVRNGTWIDPTVAGYLEVAEMSDPATPPDARYRYVARSQLGLWADAQKKHPASPDEVRSLHEHMNALVDVTARMHRDGVHLLAGTDAAGPRLVGFSLHRELGVLVHAGLSPWQALQTATLNPAIAFHRTQDLGTVEAGKLADLVVLDGNPLQDIRNTERIDAVIKGGKLYRRAGLERLKNEAERLAARR